MSWQQQANEHKQASSPPVTARKLFGILAALSVLGLGLSAGVQHNSLPSFLILWLALSGVAWIPVSIILIRRMSARIKTREVDENALHAQRQVELFRATRRDALTGLPSRAIFYEVLAGLVAARPAALLVIDIDHFNDINATYGDATGDDLLRAVGDRLRTIAGQREYVGRLDGDEFGLVIDRADELKRLNDTVAQVVMEMSQPYPASGILLEAKVSIGVARAPDHGTSTEALLQAARLALQNAKASGGATWRLCGQEESNQLKRRARLRTELSQAIETGQIIPFYQPIVSLPNNTIAKFEVLARWSHPTLGMLEPDDFIPMAEELGLAGYLTMALLRQVALDLREWPDWTRFAINASAAQLRELISFVRDQPGDWQRRMDLSRLDVELTETALMRDRNMVRELIDVLHAHGARVGLDNFGSGYANFFHLRELPFDTIKIGKPFISAMLHDTRAESCVLAMIWLGHGLGIEMVADGVETQEMSDRLAKIGCHYAQGFLYAHPAPAAEVAGLLEKSSLRAEKAKANALP
jgi:diguanylate cyclase (GGDEF)-like protein